MPFGYVPFDFSDLCWWAWPASLRFLRRVPPVLSVAAGAFAPCGALGWRSVSPPFLVRFTCVLAQHAKYRA